MIPRSEQWACDIPDGQVRLSPGGMAYQHYVWTRIRSGEPYGCEWMGAVDTCALAQDDEVREWRVIYDPRAS